MGKSLLTLLFIIFFIPAIGQQTGREEALKMALENHPEIKAAQINLEKSKLEKSSAFDLPKTMIYHSYDQNNVADNGLPLKVWGIQQSVDFPAFYGAKRRFYNISEAIAENEFARSVKNVSLKVEKAYNDAAYDQVVFKYYDSISRSLQNFSGKALKQFEQGEVSRLAYLSAEAKYQSVLLLKETAEVDYQRSLNHLKAIMFISDTIVIQPEELLPLVQVAEVNMDSIGMQQAELQIQLAKQQKQMLKFQAYPELNLEYFVGNNNGSNATSYHGFQVGLAFPLWLPSKNAAIKAEKLNIEMVREQSAAQKAIITDLFYCKQKALLAAQKNLDYQINTGKQLAHELALATEASFIAGAINSIEYLYLLDQLIANQLAYYTAVYEFNSCLIDLVYFTNGQ